MQFRISSFVAMAAACAIFYAPFALDVGSSVQLNGAPPQLLPLEFATDSASQIPSVTKIVNGIPVWTHILLILLSLLNLLMYLAIPVAIVAGVYKFVRKLMPTRDPSQSSLLMRTVEHGPISGGLVARLATISLGVLVVASFLGIAP